MRFAAGITLYYPSNEQYSRILDYCKVFEKVIVVDNTEEKGEISDKISTIENVVYLSEDNIGLPKAFNVMLSIAHKEGYDFLCLLDQDSIFKEMDINVIANYIRNYRDWNSVGIFAPQIIYGSDDKIIVDEQVVISKWVITSGSFLNIQALIANAISYDENYFIDRCDADICRQITIKELKILMISASRLYQSLGEKNDRGFSEHSCMRHYYIFRDRLYYNKKFYRLVKRWIRNFLQTMRHYLEILLYEHDKYKKIRISFIAYHDYLNKRTGKAVF